ncbi:L-histidine N(alpha)-methyltransferase [Aurantiacibacter aquimixticola]|uniref:L-histidine N(Alpha)-methyltransferase n=1 Tax=Aurantiacibacter aquimixticola TaxID=1958945 RepID=A0A419RQL2_9SPHN|nr:L-histidine N(alpha)-methyltransferase [Aurantiacibacter aquimixticola]RJY08064.1 L-histidine N(alpha)-methyltransferase [Aurantiacibacter aquimixticola]
MTEAEGIRLVDLDEDGVDRAFRADVIAGLSEEQKAIPARWFYDERGSQLFEDITQVEEYYPTRAETEILREQGQDFAKLIGPSRAVVEFGSGSSVKTPLLLSAIEPGAYVPLDISGEFLRAAAADLAQKFPELPVHPVEADFTKPVQLPNQVADMPKLGFFPGSTIGNMVPRTAVDLLRNMREILGDGASLLIGMDLIKGRKMLEAAYDDAEGVTAAFNLNLLTRINRELGANIPEDAFRHEARWNDMFARIEMHLVAERDVNFTISGRDFSIRDGESIHTENSHKFGKRSANTLLLAGHWTPLERWTDSQERFSILLAEATVARSAP